MVDDDDAARKKGGLLTDDDDDDVGSAGKNPIAGDIKALMVMRESTTLLECIIVAIVSVRCECVGKSRQVS